MMERLKRPIPNGDILLQRKESFAYISTLSPKRPLSNNNDLLEKGNNKTGYSGLKYNSILIWNLPPLLTCPAITKWCRQHCYNANMDSIKYPLDKWLENWWWFENEPEQLFIKINNQIELSPKPCAIRLHSSGDFFSLNYIAFWKNIILKNNDVSFWGYTRSWILPNLSNEIYQLKEIKNINLFASWDKYMGKIPNNWNRSVVCSDQTELNRYRSDKNFSCCPEQFGQVQNCASCGFCATKSKSKQSIAFILH
jgi:hypothetical protein